LPAVTLRSTFVKISAAALVAASVLLVYWRVIVKLIHDWAYDGNYSHGFLIVPLALFFVWERRTRLQAAVRQPTALGLVVLAGGLAVLLAGLLGSELFLTRISLLGVLVGIVLFLFGRTHLRILAFPIAFLLLMIPVPAILLNQIAFPLQLVASRFGESVIAAVNIPVLREGNVIVLANTCGGHRHRLAVARRRGR
jgi:exosortase